MDIGLHYIIVFELTYRLCNISLHYRIGFKLIMQSFRPQWYRAICCKMGYRTVMSVKNKAPSGGSAPCWGTTGMAEKVSRDRGYRSDTIAISCDIGPLRP